MEAVPTMRTKRLLLRQWRDEDLEPFAALNADPQVMKHFPTTLTRERSDQIAAIIRNHFREHGFGLWAVEVVDETPFIGFVGLAIPRFEAHFMPAIEIGWRLAAAHWGRGYAPEAAAAAMEVGLQHKEEIVSFTATANTPSRRVMEKIGMVHDAAGDFDHPSLPSGHPLERHVLYRMTRECWRQRQSSLVDSQDTSRQKP